MRVLVLGSGGMLGRYIFSWLQRGGCDAIGLTRNELDFRSLVDNESLFECIKSHRPDVVVNCAGVIKPRVKEVGLKETIKINALLPHVLSDLCAQSNIELIHITTDCVFSGKHGKYDENSAHDALDEYGKSKSLGEPVGCSVIRTSIIGEEAGSKRSLIEWAKQNAGTSVSGFSNHAWNGVSCLQLAKIVEQVIHKKLFWRGVRHFHSPSDVTKFELLQQLSDSFELNLTVNKVEAKDFCDRTLRSVNDLASFDIPEIKHQLDDLFVYGKLL